MPLFNNIKNGLHVLWVKPLDGDGYEAKIEADPNMTLVKSFEDLPDFDYKSINMPPEVIEMGKKSMYHYFKAFMPEYKKWRKGDPFLMWIFPSNFPENLNANPKEANP